MSTRYIWNVRYVVIGLKEIFKCCFVKQPKRLSLQEIEDVYIGRQFISFNCIEFLLKITVCVWYWYLNSAFVYIPTIIVEIRI